MRYVVLAIGLFFIAPVSNAQKHSTVEYESDKEVKQKALKFIVFGDWGRNGEDNQREVAAEMGIVAKKFKPDFIVSTGDNIYPNGVRSTMDHSWIASYFVSGAGSELSKTVIHPEGGIYARAENGFMNFSIYENKLQVTIISYKGEHLYSATIPRE